MYMTCKSCHMSYICTVDCIYVTSCRHMPTDCRLPSAVYAHDMYMYCFTVHCFMHAYVCIHRFSSRYRHDVQHASHMTQLKSDISFSTCQCQQNDQKYQRRKMSSVGNAKTRVFLGASVTSPSFAEASLKASLCNQSS